MSELPQEPEYEYAPKGEITCLRSELSAARASLIDVQALCNEYAELAQKHASESETRRARIERLERVIKPFLSVLEGRYIADDVDNKYHSVSVKRGWVRAARKELEG